MDASPDNGPSTSSTPRPEPIGVDTVLAVVDDTDYGGKILEGSPSALKSDSQIQLEYKAKLVSYISIVISVIVGGAGIAVGLQGGALAVVGLAGETLLDGVSSLMVIWRYKKGKSRRFKDAEEAQRRIEERDSERERRFTLVIGIGFVAFAVVLCSASLAHLFHQWASDDAEEASATDSLYVAWPAFVIFIVLAVIKFDLATKLQSKTLRQDAICTAFGAVLALITGIASTCEKIMVDEKPGDESAFTVVDPMASILISLLVGGEGMRAISHNAACCQEQKLLG